MSRTPLALGGRRSAHHRGLDQHRHVGDADRRPAIRGRRSSPTVCSTARPCCASRTWPSTAATSPATPRASIAIVAPTTDPDPLASGRVTLAGVVERPTGDDVAAARDAHLAAVPAAKYYVDYSDFTLWVLRVQRVRWVGGYGRMDSATGEATPPQSPTRSRRAPAGRSRTSTPTTPKHLCAMAQQLGGFPDAIAATCTAPTATGST